MYRVFPTSTVSAYSRHRLIVLYLGPQNTSTIAGALPGTETGIGFQL